VALVSRLHAPTRTPAMSPPTRSLEKRAASLPVTLPPDRIVRSTAHPSAGASGAHGLGIGVIADVSAEVGLGAGAGATGCAGAGFFYGPGIGTHAGAYVANGAFVGAGSHGLRSPRTRDPVGALGAFVGGGIGAFVTNASSVRQLRGVAQTFSLNIGVGPVKLSAQLAESHGTVVGSLSIGPGIGLDASVYSTRTLTLPK